MWRWPVTVQVINIAGTRYRCYKQAAPFLPGASRSQNKPMKASRYDRGWPSRSSESQIIDTLSNDRLPYVLRSIVPTVSTLLFVPGSAVPGCRGHRQPSGFRLRLPSHPATSFFLIEFACFRGKPLSTLSSTGSLILPLSKVSFLHSDCPFRP